MDRIILLPPFYAKDTPHLTLCRFRKGHKPPSLKLNKRRDFEKLLTSPTKNECHSESLQISLHMAESYLPHKGICFNFCLLVVGSSFQTFSLLPFCRLLFASFSKFLHFLYLLECRYI